jgi:acetyltransferase-like isoleucine patch superfamily enzyme
VYSWTIGGLFFEIGPGCRISPPLRHSNLGQVKLGSRVEFSTGCWIQVVNASPDEANRVKLEIASDAGIGMGSTISAAGSIVLEDHVLLGRNVFISDHGHAYQDVTRPIVNQGITTPEAVRIGRNTWLGQNVVVLPGVQIGIHCIIGANSVVRNSIPDYSVAVGIPARVVRVYDPVTKAWGKPKAEA